MPCGLFGRGRRAGIVCVRLPRPGYPPTHNSRPTTHMHHNPRYLRHEASERQAARISSQARGGSTAHAPPTHNPWPTAHVPPLGAMAGRRMSDAAAGSSILSRVETFLSSISRSLSGRKRSQPEAPAPEAAPAAPEEAPAPTSPRIVGSPGSAFERVTEDWVAARAAAARISASDATDAVHAAKRQRALSISSAQEQLQQAELQAREMRRKVPSPVSQS